jgi:adenylate cyclase
LSLFNELKRRNVFRVAIAYVIMAWLVMQVADVILNNIEAPDWIFQVILLLLGIGFLIAMFFSWAFEMTPEGLKREHEVDRSQSITPNTGKKLNGLIFTVMGLALAYFAYDKFVLSDERQIAAVDSAVQQAATEVSTLGIAGNETPVESKPTIAVLPFADMSPNKDQDYFSDGLSEELLNLLAKIPELHVAARTSSFSFKGQSLEIPEIAERLKVAHVLEGSVRTAGDQIRITAQLIRADTGFHMWSETYDRNLDNVFAIQDEIATEVVAQLKITLLGAVPTVNKTDPQAYAYFLQARQLSRQFTAESLDQANLLYQQALELDPDYAEAWIELSRNYTNQTTNDLLPLEEGLSLARQATNKAVAINPDLGVASAQMGWSAMMNDGDLQTAARHFERALALEPSHLDIIRNVSSLAIYLNRLEEAISFGEYVTDHDPLNINGLTNLGNAYISAGRFTEAHEVNEIAHSLSPARIGGNYFLGVTHLLQGRAEEALASFEKEADDEYRTKGKALAFFALGRQVEHEAALSELQSRWGERWPSDVAEVYAWKEDSDSAFYWLEKELEINGFLFGLNSGVFLKNLQDDPRWPEFLVKAGSSPEQLAKIKFEAKLPN